MRNLSLITFLFLILLASCSNEQEVIDFESSLEGSFNSYLIQSYEGEENEVSDIEFSIDSEAVSVSSESTPIRFTLENEIYEILEESKIFIRFIDSIEYGDQVLHLSPPMEIALVYKEISQDTIRLNGLIEDKFVFFVRN